MTTLSAAFAVLATLLAAVGLYGVLAYTVAQRTREIGLRMALGAAPSRVRLMVLRQVAMMTVIGGAIGLAVAVAAGRGAAEPALSTQGVGPGRSGTGPRSLWRSSRSARASSPPTAPRAWIRCARFGTSRLGWLGSGLESLRVQGPLLNLETLKP